MSLDELITPPDAQLASIKADGSRVRIFPSDVRGRFIRARRVVFGVLMLIYVLAPVIHLGKHAAVHLDVEHRAFYLLGNSFNAQDLWMLVLFAVSGVFSLLLITTWRGRVWCGWACPQTVFLEGLYRPIERLIDGPRERRLKAVGAKMTAGSVARRVAKHALYLLVSAGLSHVALALFLSREELWGMMLEGPAAHPTAFTWSVVVTGLAYFNFAWFREQFCVVLCPYGRLQSVMHDRDSIIIGYDARRGEPRGPLQKKATDAPRGDCVDCKRCVTACPTAIDIRHGLQMECLACAQCIDACDEVMDRIGKPKGLIRYASLAELDHQPRRVVRPRLVLYGVLTTAATIALVIGLWGRTPFEANLLRLPGLPYVLENGQVRNGFEVHLVNKSPSTADYEVSVHAPDGAQVELAQNHFQVESMHNQRIPLLVRLDRARFMPGLAVTVEVREVGGDRQLERSAKMLGPTAAQ
ncbi:MAG: cytochrome c oxidase accessory protein CcoG [Myxococcaceae bacterium]|nr:cytochrome c oxidase accessory protein CcoG [Myxococcaceae bacterium]